MASTSDTPPRFGRYEVVRALGQGQAGTVYVAKDPLIDRRVAVKVLRNRPELVGEEAEDWRGRFEREVRVAGKLNHPSIVGVLDVGLHDDAPFIVIEYVEGTDLDALLGREGTLPIQRALGIAAEIGDALDTAHGHGIVHRDVKPGNILVAKDGRAKVADFGIAHVLDSRMTQDGVTYGTPAFMSPEQATAGNIGPASDQFSLAAVIYLMVTGELPFSGASVQAVLYRLINDDPVPPESLDPAVSKGLSTALLRGLSKNPRDRYPSCRAMIDALRDAEEHAAVPGLAATERLPVDSPTRGGPRPESRTHGSRAVREGAVSPRLTGRRAVIASSSFVLLMILLMAWTDGDRETAPGALAGSDVAASLEGTETAAGLPARNETSSSRTPRDRYGGSGGSATGAGTEVLPSKLAERAANAATVLDEVLGVAEGIPASLLRKAECVAVIPGVIKVGFGIGGRHGRGLLSCRTDGGWSLPAFVSLTGGSFGLQIGAQASDLVLVFANRGAAERLASNKVTLGGDASVSAGPVGRTAEAGTDLRFQTEIYSYSRSKGLFAGMSLEGATLRADDDANRDAYDADRRPADLLIVSATPRARELARFVSRLESVGY